MERGSLVFSFGISLRRSRQWIAKGVPATPLGKKKKKREKTQRCAIFPPVDDWLVYFFRLSHVHDCAFATFFFSPHRIRMLGGGRARRWNERMGGRGGGVSARPFFPPSPKRRGGGRTRTTKKGRGGEAKKLSFFSFLFFPRKRGTVAQRSTTRGGVVVFFSSSSSSHSLSSPPCAK